MTGYELKRKYFDWICSMICDSRHRKTQYRKLLEHLNDVPFLAILEMDENRSVDGINMRYRFGRDCGYDDRIIASLLDDHPCSILEMMAALAIRCEEHIMEDSDMGNRTGQWFWSMVNSLGLVTMSNDFYNSSYVDNVLQRFINREYRPDGEGGLFIVRNSGQDMRDIEIWYQLCMYLDSII